MSDTDKLAQLIDNILNPNTQNRKESEDLIKSSAQANPDAFITSLMGILEGNYGDATKQSACVWLKSAFSSFHSMIDDIYAKCSAEVRQMFQTNIFKCVASEKSATVRNQIADVIGDVAASLYTNEEIAKQLGVTPGNAWPNMIQTVFELYQTNTEEAILSSLRIMKNLFYYASDKMMDFKDHILMVIKQCMDSTVPKVQAYACEALGSLITTLEPKPLKHFNPLALPLIQIGTNMAVATASGNVDEGHATEVMNVLADISETEPRYLKKHFNELLASMTTIRNTKDIENGLKDQAIEIVVTISERYPEMVKKNLATLNNILELIFSHMISIDPETSDDWANPPDGFNEENEEEDDQKVVKFCMNCIDRLIAHVGSQVMLKQLSEAVAKMLASGDWKMIHAAIMALSQVGEYMENIADIEPILNTIKTHIDHENPRIRYACLHCLGQLSDDMSPDIEEKYHAQIIPMFMSRIDDPVPRVLSHSFAGLTNFLEHCPNDEVVKILEHLYARLIHHLQNGSSFVKENALAALSALSEGAGPAFAAYYPQTMNYMIEILRGYTKKEYKQIRGQSIECITIMSATMGKEHFAQFQDVVVEEMLKVQKNDIDSEAEDPQKNYLLSGWQRILVIVGDDFSKYVDAIFPSLLAIVKKIINDNEMVIQPKAEGEEEIKNEGNTYQDDEAEIAIEMLGVFLNNLGEKLCNWFQPIWEAIEPILNSWNASVKISACKILPLLVKLYKKSTLANDLPAFSRQLIARLWRGMDEENDSEVLIEQGRALQKVVEESGAIMTDEELQNFYQKCLAHLQESDHRKKLTETHKDDEEDDEPEIDQIIEEDKDKEDDFHVQIAEIIGALFNSHGQQTIPIATDLYEKFILKSLDPSMNHKMHKFGLFLICDIIDHLGSFLNETLIDTFFQALAKYAVDPVVYVRHAAVYGLGQLALRLKATFLPRLDETMNLLNQALNIKQGDEDRNAYLATNDNTVASFGKLIKACGESMGADKLKQLVEFWLYKLPLVKDKEEGIPQHEMFCELLKNNPTLILGDAYQHLKHVITIFIRIYKKKSSNDEVNKKINELFTGMTQNADICNMIKAAGFTEEEQKKK